MCAYLNQQVAEAKGCNPIDWAVKSFSFGPLALLAAVGLPNLKSRKYLRLLAEHQGAIEPELPSGPSLRGLMEEMSAVRLAATAIVLDMNNIYYMNH